MKYLNIEHYLDYVEYIQNNPVEVDLFLDKFTINYTYFFRNINVFENLEKFFRLYVKNKKKRILKVWSAPCATGDEPYTIAMILDNLKKKELNFPDFKIVASDIDTNALKIAKEGIYGEYAVHEMPEHYLNTYFSKKITELGPKYTLCKDLKSKVEFIQEDIIKGHIKDNIYDVVFCRNFFIYINMSAREKLLRHLEKGIYEGGLLALGGSENIHRTNTTFKTISIKDHFYIKNLSSTSESYKNTLASIFKRQKIKKPTKKHTLPKSTRTTHELKQKFKSAIEPIEVIPKKLEKKQKTEDLESKPLIESAEVKITEIVVNNRITDKEPKINLISRLEIEKEPINKQDNKLTKREIRLKQKENEIDEKLKDLGEQSKILERKRIELEKLTFKTREKETDVTNRLLVLERVTRQTEQRERALTLREKQLDNRLAQMEQYSKKRIQQELQLNKPSKVINDTDKAEEIFSLYEEKRIDRAKNSRNKNEITIKMGYYGLIHSYDKNTTATKFKIEGLGSGIGLILRDPRNNVFAMSYISLPSSSSSKQGYHLLFPHTFADTSVKDLYNNLLYNGANKEDIKALIVGGAKLFLDYDMTYQENIDNVKKELESLEIEIEVEDAGGLSERSVMYDTINDSLFVKKSWEFQYRKII